MLYPVPLVAVPPPPAPYEEVSIESPSGLRVSAWHAGPRSPEAAALVVFHGNGEHLGTMAGSGTLERVAEPGGPALVVEYPGYGEAEGTPSESSLLAAGAAATNWMAARYPERPLVLFGWSLGAAVAVQIAADRDALGGLVLASAWTTLDEVARQHFPGVLVGLFLRERYDSLEAAGRVDAPVLMLHGDRDAIVPVRLGRRLSEAFPGEVRWVSLPDAGHNDLLSRPEVWREVAAFVERRAAAGEGVASDRPGRGR